MREAAERWPVWWDAELFGPPHREAELPILEELRDGLRRMKLVRRRARVLYATPLGRDLAADSDRLLRVLAADLGRGDPFTESVAAAMTDKLAAEGPCEHDDLVVSAFQEVGNGGWRDPDGDPPTERDISSVVTEVICRGEGYGVIARRPDSAGSRFRHGLLALTDGATVALGRGGDNSPGKTVLVFDVELRHRLLLQAHGFEGLVSVQVEIKSDGSAITQRP